ncbi:MAG TPA: pyridoxamine 5'-phosphate oxidase family protein [Magnetospirillaceae bacterium]|nr:pyridoxamine 5'-phosphate oxidase family protein [Magnetospirillaceae bacterium]
MSKTYTVTETTRVKRLAQRGAYDHETVHAILDEATLCHVSVVVDGRPRVLPTLVWRIGSRLFIHGARKNGLFQAMRDGAEAAVAVTLMDGWVLARSAFHHSVNYRSVMAVGHFQEVTDPEEQRTAYQAMMDKIHPGRWDQVRWPSEIELKQTAVMAMELVEVSAKTRSGGPVDDAEDYALPVWAGVVPLKIESGEPVKDMNDSPPS